MLWPMRSSSRNPVALALAIALALALGAPAGSSVAQEGPSATPLPVPEAEMHAPWERGNPKADRGEAKPGQGEGSAEAPDTPEIRGEILKDLYDHLAKSKDADTAAAISAQIERLWFVSGSDTTDLLMQRALKAIGEQRYDLALKLLTTVTELQPDYAEAWNRRALVYFRMEDTERALGDLRRTLALEPQHYKALEGVASVLREAGSKKQALEALRKVTEMHPFLPGVKEAVDELTREVEGQGI